VNPTWVDLKGVDSVPETVHHVICDINIQKHISMIQNARVDAILDNVQTTELINQTIAVIKKESSRVKTEENSGGKAVVVKPYASLFKSTDSMQEIKSLLIKAIKQQVLIQIIDKFNMSQCMIFCRTNLDCDNLETFLCAYSGGRKFTERLETGKEHAYSCCVLGGMRSMEERRRNLEAFKAGEVRFMICTDVAARGIDIQGE